MERLRMTRKALLERGAAAALGAVAIEPFATGQARAAAFPPASAYSAKVPAAWFDLALTLVRTTPGFSPPVASRALGYAGVALHEALLPGLPSRRSLAGRLNGLTPVRPPADRAYHWPTVASSALAAILRLLFPTAPSAGREEIERLEQRFAADAKALLSPGVFTRSAARGATVARHVFAWSTTDGGHESFRTNFPPYTPPNGPGLWVPTPPAFSPALQPYWGSNRPFALAASDSSDPGAPPPFSEEPASAFFAEANECYLRASALTAEEEAIARFWADDPVRTATPPGHSLSILTQVVRAFDVPLDRAAEAYAKVAIAVADAFIACWRTKYRYNLLRPVTYVQQGIDPAWTPLLATPPFPEYTSGHSVQSAAAAYVLTDLFGAVALTDRTHESAGLPARSFPSFTAAAEEAAISRLYGGIHFRSAIERGLEQGIHVGREASRL
jgi:PAP2 superfamily